MSDYPLGLQDNPFPYHVDTNADHWWPKGLQRLWPDSDGYVSRIDPLNEVTRKKPPKKGSKKGFAFKRGGHRIAFGVSPWNLSFESDFDEVDNLAPPILKRIADHLSSQNKDFSGIALNQRTIDILIKFCFSLMIRSPAFRDRYSRAGVRFGLRYDEETGKFNIWHFWNASKSIRLDECNRCNVLLLHSHKLEFCFGDGVYDSIFTRSLRWRYEGRKLLADLVGDALVPLLPNLCAYLYFVRDGCGANIKLCQVTSNVASEVNAITQVYSKEQLFFRTSPPALTEDYKRNEHMMAFQNQFPLIAALRAQAR